MSLLSLIMAVGNATSFWMTRANASGEQTGEAIAVDSSGNVYTAVKNGVNTVIVKSNSDCVVQWQRKLQEAWGATVASVSVDSSGNVYAAGRCFDGADYDDAFLAKYNASGTFQWVRIIEHYYTDRGNGVAVDYSGNIFLCGTSDDGVSNEGFVAKYNSSGTIQWQRRFYVANENCGGYDVAVNASGDVYFVGTNNNGDDSFIIKLNTSGTLQWQRQLDACSIESVGTDSSGNVYVGYGVWDVFSPIGVGVAKYNSSGTIQWQQKLTANYPPGTGHYALDVDANGNSVVSGNTNNKMFVAKYNSSGTLQWQRTIEGGNFAVQSARDVATDSYGNVHVAGWYDAPAYDGCGFIAKLPADGTKTGTYTVDGAFVVYAVVSLTDSAATFTDSAGTMSDAASTYNEAAGPITDAAGDLTLATTVLP